MTTDSSSKTTKAVELGELPSKTVSEAQVSPSENLNDETMIRRNTTEIILNENITFNNINSNNNSEIIISSIEPLNKLTGKGKKTLTSEDETNELLKQNKNYTPQLSQNIFKNIIPTTKQIKLNKQWTKRHNNSSTPRFEKKYHGINPYPLVKINTPWREQIRLFCNFSHVLHPSGVIRRYWNGYILILLIYTCLVIPLTIAFGFDLNFDNKASVGYKLATMGLFIDFMLIIDILLNFRTSYKDDNIKSYVRDENQIAWKYVFSKGFVFDVITSLPLELILYKIIPNKSKIFDTITIIEFIRAIKILRIIKAIKRFNTQTEHFDGWRRKCLDMSFVVYIMVFTAHIVACGWWWVGEYSIQIHKVHPQHYLIDNTTIITYKKDNETIKSINGTLIEDIWWGQGLIDLNEDDFPRKYIISFYWAVVTLLTTGYGDITPSTTQEMFYVTIVVFLGTVLFGWIVGRVTELLIGQGLRDQLINERIESAKIFCKSIGLDKHQTRNVIDYVSYYSNNNYLGNVNDILVTLPPDVRLSVIRQERLSQIKGSMNNYNISQHCESEFKDKNVNMNFDEPKSKNIFKNIYNYFSSKSSNNIYNAPSTLRLSSVAADNFIAGENNSSSNNYYSINALKSSKMDHMPYVLLTKILFGDNKQIQNDEEFFNILSLKIKKMTIKEGELFTRSDQIETTLFITLNTCVVRYSYKPSINFSDDDWIPYLLPPYTILGNLHSKYDVDLSIQCYQDNGCLVYVLDKEDISSQLKLLDYRLENHETEKVYNKLIKTNYHGLVIPYNKILKLKLLKSKVRCKTLRKNGFTAKTIKRRKHFSKDISKYYTKEEMDKEFKQQKNEEKQSEDESSSDENDSEMEIIRKKTSIFNSNIWKSIKKYEKKKRTRKVTDFNDRELLLHISKTLTSIKKRMKNNNSRDSEDENNEYDSSNSSDNEFVDVKYLKEIKDNKNILENNSQQNLEYQE